MKSSMKFAIALGIGLTTASLGNAQTKERTVTRLFWQDASDQSLKTGDLKRGATWKLEPTTVAGFPQLDADKQSHVQMRLADGILLAGIHDTEDGEFQSGWVAIDSGVTEDTHGNHAHWHYAETPRVLASRLDDQQGNPAHVYLYESTFYLANDKKNGFTVVEPAVLRTAKSPGVSEADQFVSAGGGHITLAAVAGRVAYATWIDREGENLGRVDVVGIGSNAGKRYHFHLPSGGLHGATTNSGKIFFAPTDGVCWVAADMELSQQAADVDVNHISLGEDKQGDPKRTGAFANSGNHVLFTVGRSTNPELLLKDTAVIMRPPPSVEVSWPSAIQAMAPSLSCPHATGPSKPLSGSAAPPRACSRWGAECGGRRLLMLQA